MVYTNNFYSRLISFIVFLSICLFKKIDAVLCPFYPHNNRSLHFELADCPQCCEGKASSPDEACCYAFFRWYYVAVPVATIAVIVVMIVTAVILCQQSFKRNHRKNGLIITESPFMMSSQLPYIHFSGDEMDDNHSHPAQNRHAPSTSLSNNKATNSASYIAAGEKLVKKTTTVENDDEMVWERGDNSNRAAAESLNMRPRQTVTTTSV